MGWVAMVPVGDVLGVDVVDWEGRKGREVDGVLCEVVKVGLARTALNLGSTKGWELCELDRCDRVRLREAGETRSGGELGGEGSCMVAGRDPDFVLTVGSNTGPILKSGGIRDEVRALYGSAPVG